MNLIMDTREDAQTLDVGNGGWTSEKRGWSVVVGICKGVLEKGSSLCCGEGG